ncbi:MAG TPA: HEAT repeat domain-containing protein [Polyangiaceae bacterium]|jgi:HEAT repeat protein
MSEVDKIVDLLSSDAVEKRIAAAIVLGEIRAKGAHVADALTKALDSDIPLLQRHALEALGRVGAKKAASKILALLAAREEDVRRAAVEAIVSIGDDVLPTLRARMADANAEERRSIDAVLAALGGKDAFHVLLGGLASSDAESAKAAAIGVRQRVKDADARQRRSYLSEAEKFLEKQKRQGPGSSVGAIAAGVKILGYLEDEKAIPTLIAFTAAKENAPAVRQEALIALRFLLGSDSKKLGAEAKKVIAALVDAAEDADRALSQTALHTLAGVTIPDDALKRLEKIVLHPDLERARFVMEMLGRQEGSEPAKALVKVLATTKDKRRAEIAASCLVAATEGVPPPPGSTRHLGDGHGAASPGMAPVREAAVAPLAKALLETDDADRAWLLRSVLKPSAKKMSTATRKEMLELGIKRLAAGDRNWEALLATARDADAAAAADAMRDVAHKLRKANPDKALTVLRVLCRSEGSNDEDRYALASAELARGVQDTRPAARSGDEALRLLGSLLDRGVDVGSKLRKDKSLELDHLYYVGFHFSEEGHPLGEELLRIVADEGGRAKIGKMARSKLALAEQG